MEQVFADVIRTIIDYWMNQEWGNIVNFLAVLELAAQVAISLMQRGATAPLNED